MRTHLLLAFAVLAAPAQAGELPAPLAAKLLSLVVKSANDGARVACKNPEMIAELQKLGIEINPSARIVWADNLGEVKIYSSQNKCVVGNNPAALGAGASLVMFEDGGKPKLMVNPRNLQKSGVALSDQILKAAMGG